MSAPETAEVPTWLLEQYGTLEAALAAADRDVAMRGEDVRALTLEVREAMERLRLATGEFNRADRECRAAYDRFHNMRKHRDWVESLLAR